VGVFEHVDGRTDAWLARFRTNGLVPGAVAQPDSDFGDLIQRSLGLIVSALRSGGDRARARFGTLLDLVTTMRRGINADGLLRDEGGFSRVDDEDFRAWLRRHGAKRETIDGGLVRAMYDFVFGYRNGNRGQPAFAAGLGVFLSIRLFLDYRGSLFWKMTAGMG